MLRKALVCAALAVLVFASPATAGRAWRQIMPGVQHIWESRIAYGHPLVLHMLLGPQPGGLYALGPVLSNKRVTGRETVSSMQRRLSSRATLAGVNGDLFGWEMGYPSGIFLRRNTLATTPLRGRSSLGIGRDGLLRIGRVRFVGRWRGEGAVENRRLGRFNRPLATPSGFALFVPSWGARTPSTRYVREAILTGASRTFPNVDRTARVLKVVRGSGHLIPAGGAILQARGVERPVLVAQARPDTTLTFRLGLAPWWEDVREAIGGGPVLVRAGVPVYQADEWFTSYHLDRRHPRTAVGQLADGRVLLVVADGRSDLSWGLTNAQLASEMVRLGAVEAMALDGGGSSTMAFDGKVLNRPSDGSERPIADSLQLFYFGVYAPPPRYRTFSPNGDGAFDVQRLMAKLVRRSSVDYRLVRPDGKTRWQYQATLDPGMFVKRLRSRRLPEGTWRWVVEATDGRGLHSRMVRRFTLNNTLGFLTLSKDVMIVRPRRGGRIVISFRLDHAATVDVGIRRNGRLVRRLVASRALAPGGYAVVWDGRRNDGRVVYGGVFRSRVQARNQLGSVSLAKRFVVRRLED